jgi:hypothetical protein
MTGCVSCVVQNGDQVVIPFYGHEDPAEVALQFGERYDLSAHAIRRLKDVINSNRERVQANAPLTATTRVPAAAAQAPPSTSAASATSKSADSGSAAAPRGRKGGDVAAQREGGGEQQVPRKTQRGRSPGIVGARPGSATRTRPDPFADQGAWHGTSTPAHGCCFSRPCCRVHVCVRVVVPVPGAGPKVDDFGFPVPRKAPTPVFRKAPKSATGSSIVSGVGDDKRSDGGRSGSRRPSLTSEASGE